MELAFLESYGSIAKHLWFGDGYILVGFRTGKVVVVSSHSREIAEEVHQATLLDVLTDAAYSQAQVWGQGRELREQREARGQSHMREIAKGVHHATLLDVLTEVAHSQAQVWGYGVRGPRRLDGLTDAAYLLVQGWRSGALADVGMC
eukprot:364424-Chlamydomonas_euryale.AAC.5